MNFILNESGYGNSKWKRKQSGTIKDSACISLIQNLIIDCFQAGFNSFSGPPFPPKNVTRYFPEAALLTSVYLRWTPIPVVEQGGELTGYEISYWVNGKLRKDNKTDLPIQQPQLNEQGFFTHEIKDLQSDVEYKFLVYGKNQYLSDSIDPTYYSKEIIATPSDRRK